MRDERRGGGVGVGVGGDMVACLTGSSSWLMMGTLGGWHPLGVGIVKVGICFSFSLRVAFFFCDFVSLVADFLYRRGVLSLQGRF